MSKIYKIGIIGCGGIANGKHMPALKPLENVEMVAFCDIVPERAEKAKKDFGTENPMKIRWMVCDRRRGTESEVFDASENQGYYCAGNIRFSSSPV